MLLGCIGDDFTGSSDLGNTLSKQGMRTVQYSGIPTSPAAPDVEAGVIALKSRSIAVADAVTQSLEALAWLQAQGCTQFFFKYCSTFDSTQDGNIGPVADALAEALDAHKVIVCPAFPGTGRSVYQGHLFVNDTLLSESGMENHPLTPMTDPDLRRWLAHQTKFEVGHVAAPSVLAGRSAITSALEQEHENGRRLIVVDAIDDGQLMEIGAAARDLPLVTGGSGVAIGLPNNFKEVGSLSGTAHSWTGNAGKCVAISGSCSRATREQVEAHAKVAPTLEILADKVISGATTAQDVADWLLEQSGVPLAYSSAAPEVVAQTQAQFGRDVAAEAMETLFADVSKLVVEAGVERIIVAGGETSGAVIEALDLTTLEFGPEIDPGVPALRARDTLVVALKSGNFGAPNFFSKASDVLAGSSVT